MEESTNIKDLKMVKVEFIAPEPLLRWIQEQATANGIDQAQFLNALLYAVWSNYEQNKKQDNEAQKSLSS